MTLELPKSLREAVEILSKVPGFGPRTAQRTLFWFLNHDAEDLSRLVDSLNGLKGISRCIHCNSFTDSPNSECPLCRNAERDRTRLAVVESFADEAALESSYSWDGLYFVLTEKFSPLDSRGAKESGLYKLMDRIASGIDGSAVEEVLVATSYTPAGDAAAYYIIEAVKKRFPDVKVTRLARGIPTGIEIEYTDLSTLAHAMYERKER